MNREYKFVLTRNGEKKIQTVSAVDSLVARDMIKESFPDWQVNMFWVVWPFNY